MRQLSYAHKNFKRLDLWLLGWIGLAENLICVLTLGWRLPAWSIMFALKFAGRK